MDTNILLAVIGYLVFAVMIYLLLSEKVHVLIAFSVIPVVGCIIAGLFGALGEDFSLSVVSTYAMAGVSNIASTFVMLIFAVLYFAVANESGMFDAAVNKLAQKAGDNVIAVALVTAIIAALGHLDGASVSTILITVPLMLPIYKRLRMRPELLLCIIGFSMAFMTFVSWNGSTAKGAVVLGVEANDLWRTYIPTQIVSLVLSLAMAAFLGYQEKRRIASLGLSADVPVEAAAGGESDDSFLSSSVKELTPRQKKLVPVNLILTVALIVAVMLSLMNSALLFILGTCISLLINYPNTKDQGNMIKKFAGPALITAVTCIAAGVMIGCVSNSGMVQAMVEVLVNVLPNFISSHLQILLGLLSVPLVAATGMTGFYLGIMPIVVSLGEAFNISSQNMFIWMAIGEHFGEFLHPGLPGVILALGLTGVSYRNHLKFSIAKVYILVIATMILAVIMGQAAL